MRESFDFQKGGVINEVYFRPLKSVADATVRHETMGDSEYYHYEPGDGTRYEVLFNTYNTGYELQTVMTLVNFGTSMIIPFKLGLGDIGYMHEKLQITSGSCYALIQLANAFFKKSREALSA